MACWTCSQLSRTVGDWGFVEQLAQAPHSHPPPGIPPPRRLHLENHPRSTPEHCHNNIGSTATDSGISPNLVQCWPNSGSESEATKKGTLFVLVLFCSMDWGSIHVFQSKNVGSTQELGFTLVEWTLTSKVLSNFPYPSMQLLTFNAVNFFLNKLLHEGGIYTFARALMNYKTFKLNVDYHFLNINIFF